MLRVYRMQIERQKRVLCHIIGYDLHIVGDERPIRHASPSDIRRAGRSPNGTFTAWLYDRTGHWGPSYATVRAFAAAGILSSSGGE